MSFINSVLASITGEGPALAPLPVTAKRSDTKEGGVANGNQTDAADKERRGRDNAAKPAVDGAPRKRQVPLDPKRLQAGESRPTNGAAAGKKRPAEDELFSDRTKGVKVDKVDKTVAGARTSATKPAPLPSKGKPNPAMLKAKSSSSPPKKGSFAEVMARGQAIQDSGIGRRIGQIVHKPTPKLTLAEQRARRALKAARKGRKGAKTIAALESALASASASASSSRSSSVFASGKEDETRGNARQQRPQSGIKAQSRKGNAGSEPSKRAVSSSKAADKPDSGYKGTARPATSKPTYTGTAKSSSSSKFSAAKTKAGADTFRSSRPRPASFSEEEEDDHYASAVSSDMEAAAEDLELEEHLSLQTARREDEAALREEQMLKRRKEQKRKALQALSAKRR
ncbi:MAG: hypothetical protein M1825_002352 [Sarcosagium campestre]|nr:MAG: hypothetical protein M1825_002352 [Sarcosagium campestre]